MNIKKILFGEKVPDKDDPKYRDIHDESEAAGRKVAEKTGMGKIVAKVQGFADNHRKSFFTIIIAYAIIMAGIFGQRIYALWHNQPQQSTAVERQERALGFKHLAQPGELDGVDDDKSLEKNNRK